MKREADLAERDAANARRRTARSTAPEALSRMNEVALEMVENRIAIARTAKDEKLRHDASALLNHDVGLVAPKVVEHHHLVTDPREAFENLARMLAAGDGVIDAESIELE